METVREFRPALMELRVNQPQTGLPAASPIHSMHVSFTHAL